MEFEEFDIEFLAQKLSENPESPLFARLADLYISKGQAIEAVKITEEGIKFFPNYYAGYIVLGKAHLALKEFSKAINAFEKALELSSFNQTVSKLIQSVPNKSDESVRTTDEKYFSQSSSLTINQTEPIQETSNQDQTTLPEISENQNFIKSEELSGSTYDQPSVQSSVVGHEGFEQTNNGKPFPSFDEYFAQNQHRIGVDTEKKLDDYLNENQIEQVVPQSRDIIPANLSSTELEVHFEPEPVFSSPEQAQLFAEMAEEETRQTNENKQQSDLDSLAEKLQSAEKIVLQDNYQSKNPLPDSMQEDHIYETDAVTPTLAEIYASQGELRAAIQAYEILMFSQPEKGGEFQKRIRELQQLQMEKDGLL